MIQKHLHITSSTTGSIGEITRDLVKYLKTRSNFKVTCEFDGEVPEKDEILLSHFVNPAIIRSEEFNCFSKKILIQPIDGTDIKPDYVDLINQYDLIITPGKAGKKIMSDNGIYKPIIVIPNYYKEEHLDLSDVGIIKQIPKDKVVFYHESTFHPRKGIEMLYKGFVKAFSDTEAADKVVLVCKDIPYNQVTFDQIEKFKTETIRLQSYYSNPASIIKITQYTDWDKLKALWKRADCYVSFAKIEGFGIPLLRMAAMGKPILTLNNPYCGYLDFLNQNNAYLVPCYSTKAPDEFMQLYTPNTQWCEASLNDIVRGFRHLYNDYTEKLPKKIQTSSLEHLKYENVMEKYIKIIDKI